MYRQQSETQPQPLNRPIYLFWNFSLRGRPGFPTHLEAMVVLSGNSGQETSSLYSPYASLQLAGTSQRKVYALVWSLKFCNSNPGNTSRLPALEASRVYDCGLSRVHTWAYFENYNLSIWLPFSPKLGADWDPSLQNLTDLGIPSTTGT